MPRLLVASALLLAGACTDYAVHVDFDIPPDYRDDVQAISLAVVVPPPAGPFDCEALAFGEVDAATVHLATVQQITIASDADGATPLAGIPRAGTKLFWAQGLDAQELPLVAGCAELGDVDGVVEVVIPGEPTAVLVLPEKDPGAPLPDLVDVRVADARGQPLAGAEVRFTVLGPAAEETSGTATTDDGGRVDLAPERPTLPGPQALDVRVRWNRAPTDSLLGFGAPPVLFSTALPGTLSDLLGATEVLYVVGRVGPSGEPGFAGLGPLEMVGGGRQALLAWYDAGQSPPFRTVTSPMITGAVALGLITPPGEDRDRVVTITGTSWIEIEPAGTLATSPSPAPGRPATRIVPAGDCATGAGDRVLVSFSDDSLAVFDSDRAPVTSPLIAGLPAGARVVGSGCASATTDALLHRTVAFSSSGAMLIVTTDLDGGRRGDLAALAQGVGFAPALAGGEAHLLASEVDVDGVVIGRWRLSPLGTDQLELDQVTDDGSTAPPLSTQGGDVDGDGQVDVIALLGLGDRDAATSFRVKATLAVDHLGGRLDGISEPSTLTRPRMLLHDFDGDAIDDVLIGATDQAIVLRMGD